MRRHRRKDGPWLIKLVPLMHCYLIILFTLFVREIFIIILLNAGTLKWFTLPMILFYLSFLTVIAAALWWRKRRIELMMLLGEELFYEEYPFDRVLHQKKLKYLARRNRQSQ